MTSDPNTHLPGTQALFLLTFWAPATFHQVFSGSLCTCFSLLGWMLTSKDRGQGCFVSLCQALGWHGGAQYMTASPVPVIESAHSLLGEQVCHCPLCLSPLLTVTRPLLTLLPHHSTSLYPHIFLIPTMILISAGTGELF